MDFCNYLAIFAYLLTICNCDPVSDEVISKSFDKKAKETPEWAFSPSALLNLAKFEAKVYNLTQDLKNSLKKELVLVDRWIQDYEESLTMESSDNIIAENPLMKFRLIRRFAKDLESIQNKISTDDGPEKRFMLILDDAILPKVSDLQNIADSIIRLQNIYDFTARDLVNGHIRKADSDTPPVRLSLTQGFEIGKRALDSEMYPEALDWLQTVLRLSKRNAKKNSKSPGIDVEANEVKTKIRQLIHEHDAIHDEIDSDQDNYYDLNLNRFVTKINTFSNWKLKTLKTEHVKKYLGTDHLLSHFSFMLLCAGHNFQTQMQKSKLFCYYETISDPYWRINPLKIEVHNWDPYLIQIYGVIGNSRIEFFKQIASPYLVRSTVGGNGDAVQVTSGRTSSQTLLHEDDHPELHDFNAIVAKITGLQVDNRVENYSSEPLQIAAYSFGGHYGFHIDSMEDFANDATGGDRLATFMIYLNDVKLGGHTAFPTIGTAVAPVKGSAVLWFNLKKNGNVDGRTFHGGCPVILGSKWIANKWIRYNANFQKHKCTLNSRV